MMRLEQRLQPVTRDRQWLRARQQGGERPLADLDEKIAAVLDCHSLSLLTLLLVDPT
jgi:hypothetical protein